MAVLYSVLFLLLGLQQVFGEYISYNDNCPDLSRSLGDDCTVNSDCTKITCTVSSMGDKVLTWTIKINKCAQPVTVDISVTAMDFSWSKTFQSDERVGVPGLSMSGFGLGAGVFVKVSLPDSGSNLNLKVEILIGIKFGDTFKQIGDSVTLMDSALPISTYECGIERWFKNLALVFKILIFVGAATLLIGSCICCCCCCCRNKSPGTIVMSAPPPATVISTTNTNVPMRPFVDEI